VEELIGDDDVERLVFLLEAADGARRQDPLDAEHLEAVDVGAEVQLRRQDAMPDAVPRQEGDPLAAQRADHVRPRGIAKRRRDPPLLAIGHLRHVVQAAAADDADGWVHLVCFNSISTPPVAAGCTNAIRECSAPRRGASSISRTPRALSCASTASMSSTRSVMWC